MHFLCLLLVLSIYLFWFLLFKFKTRCCTCIKDLGKNEDYFHQCGFTLHDDSQLDIKTGVGRQLTDSEVYTTKAHNNLSDLNFSVNVTSPWRPSSGKKTKTCGNDIIIKFKKVQKWKKTENNTDCNLIYDAVTPFKWNLF